jgi:hypothetical protein
MYLGGQLTTFVGEVAKFSGYKTIFGGTLFLKRLGTISIDLELFETNGLIFQKFYLCDDLDTARHD